MGVATAPHKPPAPDRTPAGPGIPPLPVAPTVAGSVFLVSTAAAASTGLSMAEMIGTPTNVALVAAPAIAASAVTAARIRARARQDITDRCAEALARNLGYRAPTRRAVSARRWQGGWLGAPEKVIVYCGPAASTEDQQTRRVLRAELGRFYGAEYRLAKTSSARRRLVFRRIRSTQKSTPETARGEEILLDLFGQSATVSSEVDDSDQIVAFRVHHHASVKFSTENVRRRAAHAFNVNVPGQWRAHWEPETDDVRFTRRPVMPDRVDHPEPAVTAQNRHRLAFAQDEDGDPVVWNLRGSGPHTLISGPTGSGKTVAINTLVTEATAPGREFKVRIVDPKRIEFLGLRGWPNVEIVATDVADQLATIVRTWEEMEHRYELIEQGLADESSFEPVILVLDEYRALKARVDAWWQQVKEKGQPTKCPIYDLVGELARRGRTGQVHVLLGTQRPDADFLTGEMRSNFTTRISTGQLDRDGALMMWASPFIGVAPPPVAGRAVAMSDAGAPADVQVYWTPDPRRVGRFANAADADNTILERIRPPVASHARMRPVYEADTPAWVDVIGARWEKDTRPLIDYSTVGGTPAGHSGALVEPTLPPPAVSNPTETAPDERPDTVADDDPWLGYSEIPQMVTVDEIELGALVRVDDELETWAVVEDSGPDLIDDAVFTVDWRDADGHAGALQVPPDAHVACRLPGTSEPLTN